MTSISSSYTAYQSPRDRLQSTLLSEISSGSISSTDKDALTTALDTIDKTLSGGKSSSSSSSTPPSPDEMKEKISSLIQDQVDAGTLTSDQADELTQVFEDSFSSGPQGAGGAGGPPPPPPGGKPGGDKDSDSDTTSSTSSTSATTTLADLLKQLQEAVTAGNQNTYGASGSTSSTSSSSYLLDLVA